MNKLNTKLNYDDQELKKFAKMAHQWWDTEGVCAPLHAINPLRLEFMQKQVDLRHKNILDIGCGGGILTESLALQSDTVTGIDLSLEVFHVAKLHLLESNLNIHYEHTSVEAFAKKHPKKYDVVTCMEILEHVPDPEAIIKASAALAKPEGYVFFSTLSRNLKSYLFAILGAEYLLELLPKGTHDYHKFINPAELCHWARAYNLQLKAMIGLTYSPLTKKYYFTDDVSVNYLCTFQKWGSSP